MKEVESIPNASRTFEALRSLGYNLDSSIADVVDNAITKKVAAKNVWVYFLIQPKNTLVSRIQDDGCGMTEKELQEAMRLGTDTDYQEKDLGKFGMGMKTASLSHCNILTVISKKRNSEMAGYRWDISHIKNKGWVLLKLDKNEIDILLKKEKINLGSHGTVVLWNDLSFIEQELRSYSSSKLAYNFYYRTLEQLRLHLRMVYHRFLDGSLGKKDSVKIYLNDNFLIPWDPFCRAEKKTEKIKLKKKLSALKITGYKKPIYIEAYTLPAKEDFSSEANWKEGKGLLSWNDSQGYYIYRANRIIRFGGWHNTKAKDEHDKLARISIDIDSSLDALFRITVNKTRVQFPELLFNHLKNSINPFVVKQAKSVYNKSGENLIVNNNFRRNGEKIVLLSQKLLADNKIKIKSKGVNSDIEVRNPSGIWLSNKINEFLKFGSGKDFEIVSGRLDGGQLWKILCNQNDKFKVIVNASHPFYSKIYKSSTNKAVTDAIDALIFSLAFAELYNKNNDNEQLFDTFKSVCSKALEKLTKEKII